MPTQVREVGRTAPPTMEIVTNSAGFNNIVHGLLLLEKDGRPWISKHAHHQLEEIQVHFPDTSIGCDCSLHQNECVWGIRHRV